MKQNLQLKKMEYSKCGCCKNLEICKYSEENIINYFLKHSELYNISGDGIFEVTITCSKFSEDLSKREFNNPVKSRIPYGGLK